MATGPAETGRRGESGFTLIESMTAAAILLVAIVLTITPIAVAMRGIDRSKEVDVAEHLAQARIEEVTSLDYADVGIPGRAPSGILDPSVTKTVGGKTYTVATDVQYVGSSTGLDVIPQGGDGVQGHYDSGVDYKLVTVTVTAASGAISPVVMKTIVAPTTVGALENVATVTVVLERYEPYGPSGVEAPITRLTGPSAYLPQQLGDRQVFPGVLPGSYRIDLFTANGWAIHPATIAGGGDRVDAVRGRNITRTIAIYRPVALNVRVVDEAGAPIPDATLTITDLADGRTASNPAGTYSFPGLVPDRYSIAGSAPGFGAAVVEADVPGPGGGTSTTVTLVLRKATTVPVTFHVDYAGWADYFINGATVKIEHETLGKWTLTTDANGNVTVNLPPNTSGFEVEVSTPWGHKEAELDFSTGAAGQTTTVSLGRPPGTGRFALYGGPPHPGFYRYWTAVRHAGRLRWSGPVDLPANSLGNATFLVDVSTVERVQIRAYCPSGKEIDRVTFRMNASQRSWHPSGSCP